MVDFAAGSAFDLAFSSLVSGVAVLTAAVQWVFVALCVLVAVEVARGVMRR